MKLIPASLFIYFGVACASSPPRGAEEGLFVRVVDVGAGLCCVVKMPGNKYMVYDAGNWKWGTNSKDNGKSTFAKVKEIIPDGATISLMVLSHSDADHLAAVDEICAAYKIKRIVWPGIERDTATWKNARDAIRKEVEEDDCEEINLDEVDLVPGRKFKYGAVTVTMISGYSVPPADWDIKNKSECLNAGSIVARITFKAKSILLCGDAIGRHIADPEDRLLATEKFMVDNKDKVTIRSDVLIASHHGADNGSALPFLKEVKPKYVVFSAGHEHQHPRASAAARCIKAGVQLANIFRTDRGDDESDGEGDEDWEKEWDMGRVAGSTDGPGDDDVDITIDGSGAVTVGYRNN